MAGDWIKMRSDLFTHPKVVRMMSALKADNLRTVGGLMSVWCLFDAHSSDGLLEGYSPEVIDDHLRWPGFSASMQAVGWLIHDPENGLSLPDFDTHNGQSAKRRAQDAERKREVRKTSASDADKTRTREEKRREDTEPKGSDGTRKRGTRLPEDWQLPKAWGEWALSEQPTWTADHCRQIALKFGNFWQAKSGKDATKLDWFKTWQNWCITEGAIKAAPGQHTGTQGSPLISPAIEQTRQALAAQERTPEEIARSAEAAKAIRQRMGNVLKAVA